VPIPVPPKDNQRAIEPAGESSDFLITATGGNVRSKDLRPCQTCMTKPADIDPSQSGCQWTVYRMWMHFLDFAHRFFDACYYLERFPICRVPLNVHDHALALMGDG
jgi:hypothetical protein